MADSESNIEAKQAEQPENAKEQRQELMDKISRPGGNDTDRIAAWLELAQSSPAPEVKAPAVENADNLNNPDLVKKDQDNISRWLGYANQQAEKNNQDIEKHS